MKRVFGWSILCALGLVVATTVWICRYSGPHLRAQPGRTGPVLANVFLGEYYLDLHELRITDVTTGQLVVEATAAGDPSLEKAPDSVPIQATADLRPALQAAGWEVRTPSAMAVALHNGVRYRVEVRGNNGFGYSNWSRRTIVTGRESMPE